MYRTLVVFPLKNVKRRVTHLPVMIGGRRGRLRTCYVRTVMYRIPYTDGEERKLVSTKCPTCKKPTEQEFMVITPVEDDTAVDPMELLKLAKRLVVCSECGTLRLIN